MNRFLVTMKNGDFHLVSDILPYGSLEKPNEAVDCIEKKHDSDVESEGRTQISEGRFAYMFEEYYTTEKNQYYRIETDMDKETFIKVCILHAKTGGYAKTLHEFITLLSCKLFDIVSLGTWGINKHVCIAKYDGVFYGVHGEYKAMDW